MKQKTSILTEIMNEFYSKTDLEEARLFVLKHIESSNINNTDKHRMMVMIKTFNSILPLQKYVTNCFLKFEGMGI